MQDVPWGVPAWTFSTHQARSKPLSLPRCRKTHLRAADNPESITQKLWKKDCKNKASSEEKQEAIRYSVWPKACSSHFVTTKWHEPCCHRRLVLKTSHTVTFMLGSSSLIYTWFEATWGDFVLTSGALIRLEVPKNKPTPSCADREKKFGFTIVKRFQTKWRKV